MTSSTNAVLSTEELHDIAQVPEDVQALFDHAERADVQFGLGWYRNLAASVFSEKDEVRVHVLRRRGRPVVALPVVRHPSLLGGRVAALGNYYTTLFEPALADDLLVEELAELLRVMRRAYAPVRSLTFAPMDAERPAFELLRRGLRESGLYVYDYFSFGNWYWPAHGNADEYLAARPGEVRSTLRRMGKKFAAAGGRIEILTGEQAATDGISAYEAVYRSSWKQAEPHPRFMPGLARLCASRSWLRLGLAWIDQRPVAAQFWIVANGKACIYKLAYDEAFGHLSPGSLLTAALMRHAIDCDRVAEIDYLTGDDGYKRAWMTHRRERRGLVAYDPRSPAGLWGAAMEGAGRVAKPIVHEIQRLRGSRPATQ